MTSCKTDRRYQAALSLAAALLPDIDVGLAHLENSGCDSLIKYLRMIADANPEENIYAMVSHAKVLNMGGNYHAQLHILSDGKIKGFEECGDYVAPEKRILIVSDDYEPRISINGGSRFSALFM